MITNEEVWLYLEVKETVSTINRNNFYTSDFYYLN